ncbi:MAG: hypothetical protein ACK2T3_16325 [Candidatus Promineifilaceae bacterium]
MRIKIKLVATYRNLLPPENNGTMDLDVEEGTTAASILSDLGVPLGESVILVDGRSPELGESLEEGSVVFAFHATAGG